MHKIGLVIGTAVIMLVGIGIVSGQAPPNETSTPAVIETPTPTATPIPQTPAMLSCQQLDFAIGDAEINLFLLPLGDPDEAADRFGALRKRIGNRLGYIAGKTKDPEPLMYRLVVPVWLQAAAASHKGDYDKMIAGLRQLHRVCDIKGYVFQSPSDTMSTDTIVEVACGTSGLIADKKRSAFLDGFWKC